MESKDEIGNVVITLYMGDALHFFSEEPGMAGIQDHIVVRLVKPSGKRGGMRSGVTLRVSAPKRIKVFRQPENK